VTPPPPPPPPTPPLPTAAPTAKPTAPQVAAVRRTVVPTSTPIPPPTVIPTPSLVGVAPSDLFFRLGSDWGSAYPSQQVNYTLVIRNARAVAPNGANDLRNVSLRSVLPPNLEVVRANVDRGADPNVTGNEVSYTISQLAPGEGVELTITTRIKTDVSSGTLLVTQGQIQYDGLSAPIYSNIVSLLVVGTSPAQAVTNATATATSSKTPTATVSGGLLGAVMEISPTNTPTITPTITPAKSATAVTGGATPTAPLPETSGGTPLGGVLLLGMTLFLRTWRLHRARERI
jgi:hypothetical protein